MTVSVCDSLLPEPCLLMLLAVRLLLTWADNSVCLVRAHQFTTKLRRAYIACNLQWSHDDGTWLSAGWSPLMVC